MKNVFILLGLICCLHAVGQKNPALNHLYTSLRASTVGVGLEAGISLNDHFTARAGFNWIAMDRGNVDIKIDDITKEISEAFGFVPRLMIDKRISLLHGHILLDYKPVPKSIFYFTGGLFLGVNKMKLGGFLVDKSGDPVELLPGFDWPEIKTKGYTIDVKDGRIDLDVELGSEAKPYLGVGLGDIQLGKKFSLKVELGVIYQGDYTVTQYDRVLEFDKTEVENLVDIEKHMRWLRWWPMLNIQLNYNIF